jgi:hypothetical protein
MNIRRITTRTAIAGATTALAAGALVGISTTAANAATVSNGYTCSNAGYGLAFAVPMSVSGDLPVPQYWAGASVAPNLLNLTAEATVDPAVATQLATYGISHARADDYGIALGSSNVPVPLEGDFVTDDAGATTWQASGSNKAFTTPNPGTVDGTLPTAFTLTAESSAVGDVPLTCTLNEGETAANLVTGFTLLKQSSATTAPAKATGKVGKAVMLPVSVSSTSLGGPVSSGKVVAKEGKKVLGTATLKKGKATLNLGKKLKAGKHTITVTYKGIPSVGGSSDKTVLTIKKK